MIAQADKDSIVVTEAEVDQELSRRMAYFIQQFGSEEKLELFYGKRTNVIKDELRSEVQEQISPVTEDTLNKSAGMDMVRPPTGRMKTSGTVRRYIIPRAAYTLVCNQDEEDLLEAQRINAMESYSPAARAAIAHYDAVRLNAATGAVRKSALRVRTIVEPV